MFQLSGDHRWLEDPYRPTRTRGLGDHDSGGFSAEVQAEIHAAAVKIIGAYRAGRPAAVPAPRGDLLVEMMSVCMGEPVTAEFEPMMAQELGFAPRPDHPADDWAREARSRFHVLVVGAGVSGLLLARELNHDGYSVQVIEQRDHIGGTWLDNRYPGAGVDTPSYLYSYTLFDRSWSSYFARRDEVLGYLEDAAREFGVEGAIELGVRATSAVWDADARQWTVHASAANGERTYAADAVVTAVGQLNVPQVPDIPGLDRFHGEVFHSARWPEGYDVAGQDVAVVGSGASAMQIVPAVAPHARRLTVFQRSPQWVAPSDNYFEPIDERVHWLMENVPYYRRWYRFRLAWTFNDKTHPALQVDPDWPHLDRSINAINDGHRKFFTKYLRTKLGDREDLVAKALPTYPPFGKRMLLDNGWFDALRRDNVELVTDPITEVTERGVVAGGDEYPADTIALATGFEARRMLHDLEVTGRDGLDIRKVWGEEDAHAYLGISTPGFPNLFFTYGPNTNLGHGGSYIMILECQVTYLRDLLAQMVDRGIATVECREDVNDAYNERVDAAHRRMIWSHQGMDTWYRNSRGRVVTNSPWRLVDYWHMTNHADLDDFVCEPASDEG
ncbi:flavin-containing monooxygenase [Nocardioides halotolerans]|uniref:flavin-containing monooxygenase n=1 Tax=Nocardioides halotolerans TaxID=433660 RepID=UPI001FE028CC|nr:NAD(P)/FAD-dependent oxidoreductase [Nocardioides halotolerans]